MIIEVSDITKTYKNNKAADAVSFKFKSGEIFGFIGPNGAGKTTTMKIMATLEQPDSGDAFFDGVSTVNYPEKTRAILGYMPDSLPSYNDIEVWEYLDFFARSFGLKGEKRKQMLADVEEFTSLGGIRRKMLSQLSKGMKQRVSLARALIHDPQVLLLDEPAAGLDPRARLELRNLLKLLAEQGKAILISSHILSELQDICSGAVIIEKGKVLTAGSITQITSSTDSNTQSQDAEISIVLKTLGEAERVKTRLLELPNVLRAENMGESQVDAVISGTKNDIPEIMAHLYAEKLPIIGLAEKHAELEDIFMKVTSGKVQ